jgi:hypothetical protein
LRLRRLGATRPGHSSVTNGVFLHNAWSVAWHGQSSPPNDGDGTKSNNKNRKADKQMPERNDTMKYNRMTEPGTDGLRRDNIEPAAPNQEGTITKTFVKITLASLGLALVGFAGSSLRGDGGQRPDPRWKQLVIDVAEDARTAVLNQVNPTNALPKRGDTFINNGKIYPGGTIPGGDGFDIDTPGSTGTFVGRGTFNFDFSPAFSGGDPLLSSTEQYVFSTTAGLAGEDSLISEGQGSVLGSVPRAVVGGTGIFLGTVGEVKSEVLGRNTTGFLNHRLTLKIRTPE